MPAGLQAFEEEERGENRRLRESDTADDFGDEQLEREDGTIWRQLRTLKQVCDEVLAERGDLFMAKVGILKGRSRRVLVVGIPLTTQRLCSPPAASS